VSEASLYSLTSSLTAAVSAEADALGASLDTRLGGLRDQLEGVALTVRPMRETMGRLAEVGERGQGSYAGPGTALSILGFLVEHVLLSAVYECVE
jgi:hypothetical protein